MTIIRIMVVLNLLICMIHFGKLIKLNDFLMTRDSKKFKCSNPYSGILNKYNASNGSACGK